MWKQINRMNGVEGAYSHLVYAFLEDAGLRNNDLLLHVEFTFTIQGSQPAKVLR